MNATPIDLAAATRRDGLAPRRPSAMSVQWAAVQDAAAAVATMAGLAAEKPSAQVRDFAALIEDAGGWRFELASNGVADLSAMMRPGLQALLAVAAGGQDPTPAALSLWREYHHARAALLGLVPQQDQMEPLRKAEASGGTVRD
jgi:hypothetical protein